MIFKSSRILFLVVVFLLSISVVYAQYLTPGQLGAIDIEEIKGIKDVYRIGEEVTARVGLVNNTSNSVNNISVSLSVINKLDTGQEELVYSERFGPYRLATGEDREVALDLGDRMSIPGEYIVRVSTLSDTGQKLTSNEKNIEVLGEISDISKQNEFFTFDGRKYEVSGTRSYGFDDVFSYDVEIKNGNSTYQTVIVSASVRNSFNEEFDVTLQGNELGLGPNESRDFSINFPQTVAVPGIYTLSINFRDENGIDLILPSVVEYQIGGFFTGIHSVTYKPSEIKKGDNIEIDVTWSSLFSAFADSRSGSISAEVRDKKGREVGKVEIPINFTDSIVSKTIPVSASKSLKEFSVSVALVDSSGNILDSSVSKFSAERSVLSLDMALIILLILLLIFAVWIVYKKIKVRQVRVIKSIAIIFFILAGLFIGANAVSAIDCSSGWCSYINCNDPIFQFACDSAPPGPPPPPPPPPADPGVGQTGSSIVEISDPFIGGSRSSCRGGVIINGAGIFRPGAVETINLNTRFSSNGGSNWDSFGGIPGATGSVGPRRIDPDKTFQFIVDYGMVQIYPGFSPQWKGDQSSEILTIGPLPLNCIYSGIQGKAGAGGTYGSVVNAQVGEDIYVKWASFNARSCAIAPDSAPGDGVVGASSLPLQDHDVLIQNVNNGFGPNLTAPTTSGTYTYHIRCKNDIGFGPNPGVLTVNVSDVAPPPPVNPPPGPNPPPPPPPAGTGSLQVTVSGSGTGEVDGIAVITSSGQSLGAVIVDCRKNNSGDCDENFSEDSTVTLTATADINSVFSGWGGACSGSSTTCTLSINANDADVIVTANFDNAVTPPPPQQDVNLSVDVLGTGGGEVDGSAVIASQPTVSVIQDCTSTSGDCTDNFVQDAQITLSANSYIGSSFMGWGGPCASFGTQSQCSFSLDVAGPDVIVPATFDLNNVNGPYQLSVLTGGSGSGSLDVDPPGVILNSPVIQSYTHPADEIVTIEATADTGSVFVGWQGACSGNFATCTITMNSSKNVTAVFDEVVFDDEVDLVVDVLGVGQGRVDGSGIVNCTSSGGACTRTFSVETPVTLTAAAGANSIFEGWGGKCASFGLNPTCTFTAVPTDADYLVLATFNPINPTVTVSVIGSGDGEVFLPPSTTCTKAFGSCSQTYSSGTNVTLVPTALPGSTFVGWSGDCIGNGACNLNVTSNKNVTAEFEAEVTPPPPIDKTLTINVIGPGRVGGGRSCDAANSPCVYSINGSPNIPLTATHLTGGSFTWGGACAGTHTGSDTCNVSMTQSQVVSVLFLGDGNIQVQIFGEGRVVSVPGGNQIDCDHTGTPDCAEDVPSLEDLILVVTPEPGWTFTGWSVFGTFPNNCVVTSQGGNLNDTCTIESNGRTQTVVATLVGPPVGQSDLTVTMDGFGTVTDNFGRQCNYTAVGASAGASNTCTWSYDSAAVVTLSPQPESPNSFTGWGGDCNGARSCFFNMSTDRAVTASFRPPTPDPNLLVSAEGLGRVRIDNVTDGISGIINNTLTSSISRRSFSINDLAIGDQKTLRAVALGSTPPTQFLGWRVHAGGIVSGCGSSPVCTVEITRSGISENWAIAQFSQGYTVVVIFEGEGEGTVSAFNPHTLIESVSDTSCTGGDGTVCNFIYDPNDPNVPLRYWLNAAASSGSTLGGWFDLSDNPVPSTVNTLGAGRNIRGPLTAAQNIYAFKVRFDDPRHDLNVAITGRGEVRSTGASVASIDCQSVNCSDKLNAGDRVNLRAIPAAGSRFVSWSGCGASAGGAGPIGDTCDFLMPNNDQTVTAVFEQDLVDISCHAENVGGAEIFTGKLLQDITWVADPDDLGNGKYIWLGNTGNLVSGSTSNSEFTTEYTSAGSKSIQVCQDSDDDDVCDDITKFGTCSITIIPQVEIIEV